jgi:hypothetical protein
LYCSFLLEVTVAPQDMSGPPHCVAASKLFRPDRFLFTQINSHLIIYHTRNRDQALL